MDRAHKQIPAERKRRLKPVLNEDIRILCDKETSDSKYFFWRESVGKHEGS